MSEQLAHTDLGAGQPLVFLHGITANRMHWQPVVDLLDDRFRCINVDLLGHGASPRGSDAALFSQVGAVQSLVGHLGLDAPVLIGHSYGGFIATAAGTTGLAKGVVNIDQPFDMTAFGDMVGPLEARLRGADFTAAMEQVITSLGIDQVPADLQALARANMEPSQEVVLEIWSAVFDTPADELVAQVEAMLPAVTSPYLAIFGDTPSATEARLQALIPNGTVEVWDGLGHFVQLVEPERTADRIASFVDSIR